MPLCAAAMTIKERLAGLVSHPSSKDAAVAGAPTSSQPPPTDHIGDEVGRTSSAGSFLFCPTREPERGSLSFQRQKLGEDFTTRNTSRDQPRSFEFGRSVRTAKEGPLGQSSPRLATAGPPLGGFREAATPALSARRGHGSQGDKVDGGRSPRNLLSVSGPSRSRSRSVPHPDPEVEAAEAAGVAVVRVQECPTDKAATVVYVNAPDEDGSTFGTCARSIVASNGGVASASFAIEEGGRGVSTLVLRARFGDTPDARAHLLTGTMERIRGALGVDGVAPGAPLLHESQPPSPTGSRLGHGKALAEAPQWTVLGENADGPSCTLTALAVTCNNWKGLCEATRKAVEGVTRAWRRSNVLFTKITTARRAHFYFCVATPTGSTSGAPATAGGKGTSLVDMVMEAVNGAIVKGAKVPGAQTLSSMMSFALNDERVLVRAETGGTTTVCSVTVPHRFGVLVETLDTVAALGLHVRAATADVVKTENAHHFTGTPVSRAAEVNHVCLELVAPDGTPIIGSDAESNLRRRLHKVVEGNGLCGGSLHMAIIQTSDAPSAVMGATGPGGEPTLAASMTAHIAKANVELTLTPRTTGPGDGGSSRPDLVLLATSGGERLTVADTLAYAAKAFFDVTGLSSHLDHPAAPATKLPPFPLPTIQDLSSRASSSSHSGVLTSLPE